MKNFFTFSATCYGVIFDQRYLNFLNILTGPNFYNFLNFAKVSNSSKVNSISFSETCPSADYGLNSGDGLASKIN